MKPHKEFEEFVYKVIDKYKKILLLDKHVFELKPGVTDADSAMEATLRYPYLDATLRYSQGAIDTLSNKKELETIIIHEMCHSMTDPLYTKAVRRYVGTNEIEDERERLTDHIAMVVTKLVNK